MKKAREDERSTVESGGEDDRELESFLFGTVKESSSTNQNSKTEVDDEQTFKIDNEQKDEILPFAISTKPSEDIFLQDTEPVNSGNNALDEPFEVRVTPTHSKYTVYPFFSLFFTNYNTKNIIIKNLL